MGFCGTFVAPLSGLESSPGSTQLLSSSSFISHSNLGSHHTTSASASTSTLPSPWPIEDPRSIESAERGVLLPVRLDFGAVRPGSAARRQRSQESTRESLKSVKGPGLTFPLWLLSPRLSLNFSSPLSLSLPLFSTPHPWRGERVGTVR